MSLDRRAGVLVEGLSRIDGVPQSALKNGSKMLHIDSEEGFCTS